MALTRKLLKGMGLTDEQVDTIIEAHTDTVDGLKGEIDRFKADAEKLPGVQSELDTLKQAGDGGWKEKHDAVQAKLTALEQSVEAEKTRTARETAARAYFESRGITGANLDIAMRGAGAEISGMELDGDKIRDTTALDALVGGVFSGLVVTQTTTGVQTSTPPANSNSNDVDLGTLDMAAYIAARKKK